MFGFLILVVCRILVFGAGKAACFRELTEQCLPAPSSKYQRQAWRWEKGRVARVRLTAFLSRFGSIASVVALNVAFLYFGCMYCDGGSGDSIRKGKMLLAG